MKIALLVFFFCSIYCAQAQTVTLSKYNDAIYTLVGDTLISNKDFKIFVGQKLMVGKGSDENGWFTTISLNSLFDWYSFTLGVLGTNDIETPDEKKLRENNILRDCVKAESILYIKKIKKYGNKRHGYRYVVILQSRPGIPNTNYRCFIQTALKTGELVLPNE